MGDEDRSGYLSRSFRAFQRNLTSAGPAITASYSLVGAIVLFGGIGYYLDARNGTSPRYVLIGLVAGIVVGLYQLAKAIWRR